MTRSSDQPKRILMTGNNGYLGSVMAPWLMRAGYDVVGLDSCYFSECSLVPDAGTPPTIRRDLRELRPADLQGFDTVIHLAALSNDPIGNLNDGWTKEINHEGSVRLAEYAKRVSH